MIDYTAHEQDLGWTEPKTDGEMAGTTGESRRLEALIVESDYNLRYKAHVQNVGWQDWVDRGEIAGTVGRFLRMEAFRIELIDEPTKEVWYRVHVQNVGWTDYAIDGAIVGSVGQSLRIEAIEIRIVDPTVDQDFSDWLDQSKKCKLGDVIFSSTTGESPTMTSDITDKPIEGGNISDHALLQPLAMNIKGIITGDDAQQNIEIIRNYMKNYEVLRYVGVDIAQNVMITSFATERQTNIANGASFSISLKEVRLAEGMVTVIDEAYISTQINNLGNGGLQAVQAE